MMLTENLKKFGFTDTEVDVYQAILRKGKTTPARVAADTGIKRPTVYAALKTLIEKGVVSEDLAGPTKYVLAESVDKAFEGIVRKEKRLAKEKELLAEEIVNEVSSLVTGKSYSVPKIKFIEGRQVEEYMKNQSEKWTQSVLNRKTYFWGFQDSAFVDEYSGFIDWYWNNMREEIELRLISNDRDVETKMKEKYPRRKIKFWEGREFDSTFWVMGDYIVMLVTKDKPHYLVEIYDEVMARNLVKVFEGIWKIV